MSIDSYFCFCCMSTNDLINLCCDNTGVNYVNLLKELISIKPSKEYEEETYLCKECTEKLKGAHSFRTQVLKSIKVLQLNGLIELRRVNGELLIHKVCDDISDEEKYSKTSVKYNAEVENKNVTVIDVCKEVIELKGLNVEVLIHKVCDDFSDEEKHSKISVKDDSAVALKNVTVSDVCIEDLPTLSPPSYNIKQELEPKKNRSAIETRKIKTLTSPIKDPVVVKSKRDKSLSYVVTDDLKCPLCSTVMPNVYTYHVHMNKHFPNHICTECGKGFLNEHKLKRHSLTHQRGPFKCEFCDGVFYNYSSFYGHKTRRHSSKPRYSCPHCPFRFTTAAKRFHHLEDEHGQPRAHVCAECGKRFMNSAHLNVHQRRLHLKEKRFVCKECSAGFFMKEDLVGHMASHQGSRTYKCTLCTRSYLRKNALKVHMRLHNNERPFHCDVCGASFTQKATLMKHLKTHEKNRRKKTTDE